MIRVGFKSDKGVVRKNNEDSCFVMPKEHIYIVADGVGGSNSGETASNMVVSNIAKEVKKKPLEKQHGDEEIFAYLKECIEQSNRKIINSGITNKENRGMATTVVLCHIREGKGYFANAGDSRAYIYRNRSLRQITEDHSYVNSLLKEGAISLEEAENHEQSNMITKALGAEKEVKADYYLTDIQSDDIIILCTDGLYNEVDENKIVMAIEENKEMTNLVEELIKMANNQGGKDNITVICLKVEGGSQNE